MNYRIISFLFLLIVVGQVNAQRVLTLDEAIATTLQNNFDIQLARNDSAVAALDYSYRNAALLPQLNATAGNSWNRNSQKQEFSDGTKRERSGVQSNNIQAGVVLNWRIFDGLKMFVTMDRLQELVRLGEMGIRSQVSQTVFEVITTYYNMVRQKQQLRAVEEQISVYEDRLELAELKYEIGTGIKPDVLQGKVDLNAQRAARLQQLTLIDQTRDALNRLMNLPLTTSFDVPEEIPIDRNLSLGEINNTAAIANPQLQLAEQNIAIAELLLKERKAERWPVINFNTAYNFTRTNNSTVVNPFQPLFSQNKGLNYGFSATIPIFNNFNTRRLIRQAQLEVDYQELLLQRERAQVELSVYNAYRDYEFQKDVLELEEENISLARENVTIAMERYRLGVTTFIELREAQRSLEDAFTRLINARYNTKLAETELLRLRGDLAD